MQKRLRASSAAAPLALSLIVLAACGNPSDPAGWAKRAASRSRTQEKLEALEQARKAPGDRKAAVPHLLEVLTQTPKVRPAAALLLGEIGDPSTAPALIAAIDPAAREKDGFETNRRAAEALGALRSREAVPTLLKLTASTDAFTQIAAVDALGAIGDPAAIDTLSEIARSPTVEAVTAQHALLALGKIGDARAAPVVVRMMYDRQGTCYPHATFAAIGIGKPMEAPLLAVLEGKDAALEGWARDAKLMQGVLYAKAAQVLSEVGGPAAAPALLSRLAYRDADPTLEQWVRVFAAEALGRLRARQAVGAIAELLARESDPDARLRYAEALTRIGDPAALPALRAAAGKGGWLGRYGPLVAVSRLGGAEDVAAVEGAGAAPCEEEKAPLCRNRAAELAAMKARLAAAAGCGDVKCWAAKLGDASPAVRDRAALQVGFAGTAADAPALAQAVLLPVADEAGVEARYHAILALRWIADREPLGAAGAELAGKIEAMVAAPSEKGRRLTGVVNEDALRLAARLRKQ
ncbi:MAG TPA: HEAT repeat domain-containing protein [Anaeromyxobacter sp.]|nr:HEAT repeat domain-containing protein [Anaeromyxobacter sp.]